MQQYCQGVHTFKKKSCLNEEKENTGWNQIQWTGNTFRHPAHDDEQQQLLQQQRHEYRAAATAAAALCMHKYMPGI